MINNIAGLKTTIQNTSADNWVKKADIGNMNFKAVENPGAGDSTGVQKTFGDFLKDSVSKVNSLQHSANVQMEKLASGKSDNIAETLLAVEQADIAFRSMNQVRTKVIDAYKEIMKMQV
jgi:flagellar hook-basal body complex protein FliE